MTPIFLERPQLWSALGANLDQAAAAYASGSLPQPEWFGLHEFGERRPYLPAAIPAASLSERLNALIRDGSDDERDDCLLILASTTLDIGAIEQRVVEGAAVTPALSTPLAWLADDLRQRWGFAAAMTLNTACTSAANGLLYAGRAIASGRFRSALVIGFETPSEIARQGFGALELTSASGCYRPFHPDRDGLILGEAYASVLLTAAPTTAPLGRLLGGYSACDTSSLTTTREDGSEIERVMRRALADAGIDAQAIALTKLHGTATAANDHAECNGMQRLFGGGLRGNSLLGGTSLDGFSAGGTSSGNTLPPLCALKPFLGHTLGACGLAETLLLLTALRSGQLPAALHADGALLPLLTEPTAIDAGAPLMANYFGFGGNNASLILATGPSAIPARSQPRHPASGPRLAGPGLARPELAGAALGGFQPLGIAAVDLTGGAGVTDKQLKQYLVEHLGSAPRRIDRLSLQALAGVAPLRGRVRAATGLYLAARYPARANMLSLLATVCAEARLPKPFEFVNSVSNAAGFHVAQLLGIEGPNLFIGAGEGVWQELLTLASGDVAAGLVDEALLVLCDERAAGDFRIQAVLLAEGPLRAAASPGAAVDFATLSAGAERIELALT